MPVSLQMRTDRQSRSRQKGGEVTCVPLRAQGKRQKRGSKKGHLFSDIELLLPFCLCQRDNTAKPPFSSRLFSKKQNIFRAAEADPRDSIRLPQPYQPACGNFAPCHRAAGKGNSANFIREARNDRVGHNRAAVASPCSSSLVIVGDGGVKSAVVVGQRDFAQPAGTYRRRALA
jgi:hypothetical protein